MAGEDPGVSTLAVILELIQRAWGAVTGSIKAVVSGTVDIIKTSLFFSWRRKMMQGQQGPDLERGEQSLKELRQHEQVGAKIVTVEIGDRTAMEALREELKRLELDFAITEHDGQYTLHYKEANEQDVLYAQQAALEKLYGTQDRSEDERETPNDHDQREEHDRDGDEGRERNERQDDERERTDDSSDQDRSNDEQRREDQERESDERQRKEQEQSDQQTRNQGQVSPDRKQDGPERASQMEAPVPQYRQENAAALPPNQRFEPLEDLIKEARERARAKNMARNHPERAMRLDHHRSLARERARNFEPHH